jgi:phosphate transport system permease protein
VLALLAAVAVSLAWSGWPAFRAFGPRFLTSDTWDPVADDFGARVPILGTLISSAIALLVAVPVSFFVALFLTELAPPWARSVLGGLVDLLAGIPSVVYGVWGLFVLAPIMARAEPWISDHVGALPLAGPLFRGPPLGIGMLTAGLILAIMVIPFVSAIMREVFLVVPPMLKESAYGVGATTWEVVRSVVLPYTRAGVIGGVFLGLGRALGETMAVTFVIGNAHELSVSLLAPGTSIAAVLANEFAEATTPLYRAALLALGFILFAITLVVLVLAKILLSRLERAEGRRV